MSIMEVNDIEIANCGREDSNSRKFKLLLNYVATLCNCSNMTSMYNALI